MFSEIIFNTYASSYIFFLLLFLPLEYNNKGKKIPRFKIISGSIYQRGVKVIP